tara:strand:+ start:2591 stop:4744 length:2154 start_codon:yes stop_codon:yes gene_type:complete
MKSIKNTKYIILIVLVLILVYLLIKMKEQFFTITDTEGEISNKFTSLSHIANINNQANLLIIEQLKKDLKLVKEIESLFVEQDKTNRKGAVIKNIEKLSETELVWPTDTDTDNILTNKDTIIDEILEVIYNKYKLVNTSDSGNIVFTKDNIDNLDTKLTTYTNTNTLDINDFIENINEYLNAYEDVMEKKTTDLDGIIKDNKDNKENIEKYLINIFGSTGWGTKIQKNSYTLSTFNTREFNPITNSITAILDTTLLESNLDSNLIELYKELYKKIFKFEITDNTKLRNVLENYNGDIKLFSELKRLLVREKEIKSKGQELYEQYALGNSGSGGSKGLSIGPEDTPYFNFPDMKSLHKVDLERHFFWSNYTIEQEFEGEGEGKSFPDFTAGNEELANVKYLKQNSSTTNDKITFELDLKTNNTDGVIILIGSIIIDNPTTTPTTTPITKSNLIKESIDIAANPAESGTILKYKYNTNKYDKYDTTIQNNINNGDYKSLFKSESDFVIYKEEENTPIKIKDDSIDSSLSKGGKHLIVFKKNNMIKFIKEDINSTTANSPKVKFDINITGIKNDYNVTLNYIEIGGDEPVKTIGKLMNLNRDVLQYKYQILTNYLQCKAHGFDPNQPNGRKCNLADDTLGPYDIDSRFVNLLNPNVVQETNNNEGEGMDGASAMALRDKILDELRVTGTGGKALTSSGDTRIPKGTSKDVYTVQEIRDIL